MKVFPKLRVLFQVDDHGGSFALLIDHKLNPAHALNMAYGRESSSVYQ